MILKDISCIVCGGRDYANYEFIKLALDKAHKLFNIILIIEGGANGADSLAKRWALENNIEVHTEKAQWDVYGKSAGCIRNAKMADHKPDLCIAFPGGRGTLNMISIAKQKSIRVLNLTV